jgi:hypothetical protein
MRSAHQQDFGICHNLAGRILRWTLKARQKEQSRQASQYPG